MADREIETTESTLLCPICKKTMEWNDLIKEYECPICGITENDIHQMSFEAFLT